MPVVLRQVYRSYTEPHYHHDYVVYVCGVIQTILYVDFFYYYALRYVGGFDHNTMMVPLVNEMELNDDMAASGFVSGVVLQ